MNKIILHIFHTGKVRVDQAIPLHESNPLAVTGLFRSKKKQMIFAALLKNGPPVTTSAFAM